MVSYIFGAWEWYGMSNNFNKNGGGEAARASGVATKPTPLPPAGAGASLEAPPEAEMFAFIHAI